MKSGDIGFGGWAGWGAVRLYCVVGRKTKPPLRLYKACSDLKNVHSTDQFRIEELQLLVDDSKHQLTNMP